MALRDYLNFEDYSDFANFTLVNGQAVAIVKMDGTTPLETWYYNASSMAVPNGTTVFKPNAVPITSPGRYIKNMTESDWNTTLNKPNFADVALSGDYNDLDNKLTAGDGILIDNNELSVDSTKFMSIEEANVVIADMQQDINSKAPQVRTITINGITQDLEGNRDWEVGNVSTDEIYNNPSWIGNLSYSKLIDTPSLFSGNYNDLSNKPTLFNGTFSALTGKPTTLSGYGIIDAYPLTGNPSGFLTNYIETDPTVPAYSKSLTAFSVIKSSTDPLYKTIGYTPSSSEITAALGITPINQAGARTAISLTTAGTSGNSTYDNSTGILNIPNYSGTNRSFNNNVSRTLNSNYTISTTRDSNVNYSISLSVTNPLLAGSSVASAFLEYSTDGGTNWITVSQVVNSSSVALAVTIALTQPNTFILSGNIPANALVRIRTTTSGSASATYSRGQEMYY